MIIQLASINPGFKNAVDPGTTFKLDWLLSLLSKLSIE